MSVREQVDLHGCIRRVLVAMVVVDGDTDPEELLSVRDVFQRLTGQPLELDQIELEAQHMADQGVTLRTCLGPLAQKLDDEGRKKIMRAAFEVASADGFILEEEDQMLATVGAALGLSENKYKAILDELMGRGGQ